MEKSPILLSKFEWLDGTIIISYFDGSNNIFVDCKTNNMNKRPELEQNLWFHLFVLFLWFEPGTHTLSLLIKNRNLKYIKNTRKYLFSLVDFAI